MVCQGGKVTLRARALVALIWTLTAAACGPALPEHRLVTANGDLVRIPRAEIDDGRVHFFTYTAGGTQVDFLVRSDGTGALQAHLDACFSCYRYGMGFVVEEANLVCRACRYEYAIEDEVWEYIGACAPISIPSTPENGALVIERRVLEKAARYFP